MSAVRDASSTSRALKGISVRDGTGLRSVQAAYGRDAGAVLKTIFSGLKVVLSPDTVSGFVYNAGTYPAYTDLCTATITGGTGPFTYAWTIAGGWDVLSPTAPITGFRSPGLAPGGGTSTTAYVTVTDTSNGQTAVSNTITAYADNIF